MSDDDLVISSVPCGCSIEVTGHLNDFLIEYDLCSIIVNNCKFTNV